MTPTALDLRRHQGAHYTPPHLARYLAEHTLGAWLNARGNREVAALRVLDPACGDGALLVAAFDVLRAWYGARGESATIARHLYGLDVDAQAVAAARARLDACAGASLSWSIVSADALRPHPLLEEGFDVILGNPPYVFGEHLATWPREELARCFAFGRRGQPDLFKVFYERTLALLREGGRHGFLVPDALLARDEHGDLRRHILERVRLRHVCQVGRVFETTAGVSAAVIVTARERTGTAPDAVTIDDWNDGSPTPRPAVAAADLAPDDGGPWSVAAPAAWFGPFGLRARMEAASVPLGQLLAPRQAGLTRGEELGKRRLARRAPHAAVEAGDTVLIHAGENVQRHLVTPPRREIARAALAKDVRYYAAPKILFVKTGAGPVAAAASDDLPALQSVYILHLAPHLAARIAPDAVVAVLCSALLTTYTWCRWTSGKQLQPQLTLANVRALPVPAPDALAAASDALTAGVEGIRAALTRGQSAAAEERALDEQVARLYGVPLETFEALVATALAALPRSQRSRWYGAHDARPPERGAPTPQE